MKSSVCDKYVRPLVFLVCQDLLVAFGKMIVDRDVTEESFGLGKTKVFLK